MVFGLLRIGEASNPGPLVHFDGCHFTLGTFNPSGLRNKANYFCSHLSDGDVWAVSETHFYGRDITKFRAGLRASNSSHCYFVPDSSSLKPCLASSSSWKGVGILSKHPTRALPSGLPVEVTSSGRAVLTTTLLADCWISGGVVYGEPDGHRYPNHLRNTEYLLHHVVSHVTTLCTGCRFVAGDWNVSQDSLPAFDMLLQAGFRDVQDLALEWWGTPVQPTCKMRTRKDFLYISPELQHLLCGVQVLHDVWPDHSIVVGQFRSPAQLPVQSTWPVPSAFPWPKNFGDQVTWSVEDDPTTAYQLLWQQIEASAAHECPFPIHARAFGRAQRLACKKSRPAQFAPVKAGRIGDFQPQFFGRSQTHSQWVRQTRRLQAFVRLCNSTSDHVGVLMAESWGAILRSAGFVPKFAEWWSEMPFRVDGAPQFCPLGPPDVSVALAMFESLALAVRDLEQKLMQHSRQYARYRRAQNPNLVFADLKPPSTPGVDVLLQPIKACVEDVDHAEGKVVLDRAVSFNSDHLIVCNGKPLEVIHHEADALWLPDTAQVEIGQTIFQTKFVGTHEALAEEFIAAWKERWLRHADVPADRWNTIIQFARAHLPPGRFQWAPLDVSALSRIIHHKKKSTSHGLDGVRLDDLKHMPSNVCQAFCDMFAHAEATGQWPAQLIDGKVVSLAKVPTPGSPSDFRPITVFGLLYRCWSSYHARKSLSALEESLPATLYGSRQGRHATQLWSKLLWTIEWSFQHDVQLSGLVLDLQKAFNLLPRLAVFEIAAHVGLPGQMMVGWAGALAHMKRFFLIRQSLSDGVSSTTGFPEGCGLSCVAMVLIDAAFHRWQQVFFPLCTAISYVDDWQLICSHPDHIVAAQNMLDRFIEAVDLLVDAKKTYVWSISPAGRKLLRDQGLNVVLSAKNLGAHIQMSRKHTNASLMDRVHSLQPVWPRLRMSACRYHVKLRALTVAAWPRALHAVTATQLSDAAFHALRTGAMKGLNVDVAGTNAWLHLGLVEHPMCDPLFWAIIQTFRCLRECGDAKQILSRLASLAHGDVAIPDNGITATSLARLQVLGWHVSPDGLVYDMLGQLALFKVSLQELMYRAQLAWQQVIQSKVAHRPGFSSLLYADAMDTRAWLRSLPHDDCLLFQKCLNGCHITQDGKSYCQAGGSTQCPFCECTDSRFHRFWECPQFEHLRCGFSSHERALLVSMPEILTCYGWSIRPYTFHEWLICLHDIPLPAEIPLRPCSGDMHLFTDGTCMNPTFPSCRLAAWAVLQAAPGDAALDEVVASGPLPGILQSAYRAETFAIWQALMCARHCTGRVWLWVDCNAVVVRFRKLLTGHTVRINSAHADLWRRIAIAVREFAPGQLAITKVTAHQRDEDASSPLEEWCFRCNNLVDKAANLAQMNRSQYFWEFYAKHVRTVHACSHFSRRVQQVLLAISQLVVRTDGLADDHARPDLCISPEVPAEAWRLCPCFMVPGGAVRWYGDAMVRTILSWLWFAVDASPHPVRWISQFQLYVDFMKCGEQGPLNLAGWKQGADLSHADILGISFHKRTRWFAKVLKECLKHSRIACQYNFCRPFSDALHLHTGCLAVPWDPVRLSAVDEWFHQLSPGGVHRSSAALHSFPVALPDPRFPTVPISMV